jgi:hypothetical protein
MPDVRVNIVTRKPIVFIGHSSSCKCSPIFFHKGMNHAQDDAMVAGEYTCVSVNTRRVGGSRWECLPLPLRCADSECLKLLCPDTPSHPGS